MEYIVTVYRIPVSRNTSTKPIKTTTHTDSNSNYDHLPDRFENLYTWPPNCNLHCATCGCKTKRYPFFIPHRIEEEIFYRGTNPMNCSPSCALKLINLRCQDQYLRKHKIQMVQKLTERMTGLTGCHIIESWDPLKLEKYGGHITDRQYQDQIIMNNQVIMQKLYPYKKDMINDGINPESSI